MRIQEGLLDNPDVIKLIRLHLQDMHQSSPVGHVFALDLSHLKDPAVRFFTLWEQHTLVGCGALKMLSKTHGEIKSMRTHPDHVRKGVGETLVRHLIKEAHSMGFTLISLETGSGPAFEAAIRLYQRHGFELGDAFAGYTQSEFNQFFHLSLEH